MTRPDVDALLADAVHIRETFTMAGRVLNVSLPEFAGRVERLVEAYRELAKVLGKQP